MLKLTPLCLLLLGLAATVSLAQTSNLPRDPRNPKSSSGGGSARTDFRLPLRESFRNQDNLDLQKKNEDAFKLDVQMQALETAVDPEQYRVGPGDQFLINIWSTLENSIPARVTPDGRLVIPTIGALAVDGQTLAEVREKVKKEAARKYLNSEISVDLLMVRGIRVHVTGQVLNPGAYSLLAVNRVADAITLAGGTTSWAFERGIQVRHADATADTMDMVAYKKRGDLDANFYLRGGDVVFVPPIDLSQPTVRVEGVVNDPGTYQLLPDETVSNFLLRVEALTRRADLNGVYVERKGEADGQTENIPIFPYLNDQGNGQTDLLLQDGDLVKVPRRTEDVYVIGAVQQPGAYPYVPGQTVQDYVGFAGATFQSTKPNKARVIRRNSKVEVKGKDVPVEPGDTVFIPKKVEFGVREITAIVAQAASVLIALKAVGVIN